MSQKIILIFFLIILFSPRCFIFANLQINEIMYDLKTGSDEGREWIEIYNDNDFPVDLSSFRFFEADTSHKIKLTQGDAKVEAKSYAVIVSDPVKFKTDWPNFTGALFDSSFSLNNDGEVLAIKDNDLNIIDQYAYNSSLGGAGDGKSLQKINRVWQGAMPTPGLENKLENKISVVPSVPISVVKNELITKKVSTEQNKPNEIATKEITNGQRIPVENLEDQVVESNISEESSSSYIFIIILILLLATSTGAVYFIRRKKIVSKVGDDFKILDE